MLSPLFDNVTDNKRSQPKNDSADKNERKVVLNEGNIPKKVTGGKDNSCPKNGSDRTADFKIKSAFLLHRPLAEQRNE